MTLFFLPRSVAWVAGAAALVALAGCSSVQGWYGSAVNAVRPTGQATAAAAPALWSAPRAYAADISAARAYIGTQLPAAQRMTLIDVRDASEFRLGHPEAARHVPYPRVYQRCQPHPSGAPEAQVRSDDGSQCRYGVVPGSEVRSTPQQLWAAVHEVLPYHDAPLAVLCRTGACAAEAAQVLAQPERWVDPSLKGQGYTQVMVVREGFVGEPLPALDAAGGRVLTHSKKAVSHRSGSTTAYAYPLLVWDVNGDGALTSEDLGGWRNYLGLPYVVSLPANLRSPLAEPYYDQP